MKKLKVILAVLVFNGFFSTYAQTTNNHGLGAILTPKEEYDRYPKVNWESLKLKSRALTKDENLRSGIVMLNNPPVGDQGTQASCIGWAVGYAALGILEYPKFNNWREAKRSPNYIFNQIKASASVLVETSSSVTLTSVRSGSNHIESEAQENDADQILRQPPAGNIYYIKLKVFESNGNSYETPEKTIYAYGDAELRVFSIDTKATETESMFLFSPNPAKDLITVMINTTGATPNNNKLLTPTKSYTIQIWSEQQGLVRIVENVKSIQQVSLNGLPKGKYYIHLIVEGVIIQREILEKD